MARRPKQESNYVVKKRNPKDSSGESLDDKAFKLLNTTFLMSLNNIFEKVKAGDATVSVKELAVLSELKKDFGVEPLDNVQIYFTKCDPCFFAKNCNLFRPGGDCSYDLSKQIQKPQDALDIMKKLLTVQGDRMMRGFLIEKMDGGIIDRDVSEEMAMYFDMVKNLKEIMDDNESLTLKVKGKGVISKLFGDVVPDEKVVRGEVVKEKKNKNVAIDATPVPSTKKSILNNKSPLKKANKTSNKSSNKLKTKRKRKN